IGDINAMSERIVFLLKDEKLREQIGQNAMGSLGGNFQIENMVINTKNLYTMHNGQIGIKSKIN
ncbi:MAG: hypothetical protein V1674_04670, partial [Candidatus Omnitrophota bacterium]